jgi:3-phosphoglycerate kinase
MQAVQNRALRVIFKKYTDSNEEVENFSEKIGLMSVANRLSELNEKYVVACLDSDNPLITRLIKEYGNGFQIILLDNGRFDGRNIANKIIFKPK